jgi:hypothetical protein
MSRQGPPHCTLLAAVYTYKGTPVLHAHTLLFVAVTVALAAAATATMNAPMITLTAHPAQHKDYCPHYYTN